MQHLEFEKRYSLLVHTVPFQHPFIVSKLFSLSLTLTLSSLTLTHTLTLSSPSLTNAIRILPDRQISGHYYGLIEHARERACNEGREKEDK